MRGSMVGASVCDVPGVVIARTVSALGKVAASQGRFSSLVVVPAGCVPGCSRPRAARSRQDPADRLGTVPVGSSPRPLAGDVHFSDEQALVTDSKSRAQPPERRTDGGCQEVCV